MFHRILPLCAVALVLAACSSGPRSAYEASTFDILFTNNVEKYLEESKKRLEESRRRANELDRTFTTNLRQMSDIQKKLEQALVQGEANSDEMKKLRKDLSSQMIENEQAYRRHIQVKAQLDRIETALAQNTPSNQTNNIEELEKRIEELQAEAELLEQSIITTINTQAQRTLN